MGFSGAGLQFPEPRFQKLRRFQKLQPSSTEPPLLSYVDVLGIHRQHFCYGGLERLQAVIHELASMSGKETEHQAEQKAYVEDEAGNRVVA